MYISNVIYTSYSFKGFEKKNNYTKNKITQGNQSHNLLIMLTLCSPTKVGLTQRMCPGRHLGNNRNMTKYRVQLTHTSELFVTCTAKSGFT